MAKTKDAELEAMLNSETPAGNKDPWADEQVDPVEDDEEQFNFEDTTVKEGTYHGKVLSFSRGVSQTGNPKYDLKIQIPEIGRTLDAQLSLASGAAWKTGDALRALGVQPGPMGQMTSFKLSERVGRYCRVVIKNDTYEGRMIPKIQSILPPDEFGATEQVFAELT